MNEAVALCIDFICLIQYFFDAKQTASEVRINVLCLPRLLRIIIRLDPRFIKLGRGQSLCFMKKPLREFNSLPEGFQEKVYNLLVEKYTLQGDQSPGNR